jgi:predicted nucleic acid-binding protein
VAAEVFLLDSSALLTLIEDEAGADRVEDVLRQHRAIIPWVALLEVYYVTKQEQGQLEADRRHSLLKQMSAEVLWNADEPTILLAGDLKATVRLSLADALIAAIARQRGAILLHRTPSSLLLPANSLPRPYRTRPRRAMPRLPDAFACTTAGGGGAGGCGSAAGRGWLRSSTAAGRSAGNAALRRAGSPRRRRRR